MDLAFVVSLSLGAVVIPWGITAAARRITDWLAEAL